MMKLTTTKVLRTLNYLAQVRGLNRSFTGELDAILDDNGFHIVRSIALLDDGAVHRCLVFVKTTLGDEAVQVELDMRMEDYERLYDIPKEIRDAVYR